MDLRRGHVLLHPVDKLLLCIEPESEKRRRHCRIDQQQLASALRRPESADESLQGPLPVLVLKDHHRVLALTSIKGADDALVLLEAFLDMDGIPASR